MTDLQKIRLRLSELRSKINAFQDQKNLTEDDRTRLAEAKVEHRATEKTYRETLKAAPDPEKTEHRIETGADTKEIREFRALEDSVDVSDYFMAVSEKRSLTGKPAEYKAALGLAQGDDPLSLPPCSRREDGALG